MFVKYEINPDKVLSRRSFDYLSHEELKIGDRVKILGGVYKNTKGTVVGVGGKFEGPFHIVEKAIPATLDELHEEFPQGSYVYNKEDSNDGDRWQVKSYCYFLDEPALAVQKFVGYRSELVDGIITASQAQPTMER